MSQTFLIPIDESESTLRSIDWLLKHLKDWRDTPKIHLLNVQPPLPKDVSRFINADTIREFHLEKGMAVLSPARDRLTAAGLNSDLHVIVGEAAKTIVSFADNSHCSQILIGTRAHTGLSGTLLGSVAMKVVHLANIPVLLVR